MNTQPGCVPESETTPVRRFELAPHRSLTPRGAAVFMATVGGTTFGVATFFAMHGFWPVLPFAGLEIGLLAWALRASILSGAQRKVISISEETVTIEWHTTRGQIGFRYFLDIGRGLNCVFRWRRHTLHDS